MSGAQNIWPDGRLLIAPGQAHGIDLRAWLQCDTDLVQTFVEHANAKQLNASRLSDVARHPRRWALAALGLSPPSRWTGWAGSNGPRRRRRA